MKLCLNIGCGDDKRESTEDEEWINVDIREEVTPDLVCDIREGLPYDEKRVDLIIMKDVLEHFKEPVNILMECYRVLKKGGKLSVQVPDLNKVIDRGFIEGTPFFRTENRLLGGRKNKYDQHKSLFTKKKLDERLREAGFGNIEIKESRTPPKHWHLLCTAEK